MDRSVHLPWSVDLVLEVDGRNWLEGGRRCMTFSCLASGPMGVLEFVMVVSLMSGKSDFESSMKLRAE